MPDTNRWIIYALASALCAGAINIFGKIGMKGIDSDMATAVRSAVQAMFVIAFCAVIGKLSQVPQLVGRHLSITMIILSGICGGLSWIFVFRAIQLADVSKVAPIDKLSLPIGIILAVLLLHERPTTLNWLGIALTVVGAYLATHK
jgi:transporter family protein